MTNADASLAANDAPSAEAARPSSPAREPLRMTISRGQAGIMAAFGAGLLFCAFLLAYMAVRSIVPVWVKASLGVAALYVAWVGASMIMGAVSGTNKPVLTLHDDKIVSHDELDGDSEAPLASIVGRSFQTRTGVKALVLEFADGKKIAIPETLVGAAEAFERLGEGVGEPPPSLSKRGM